MEKKIWQPNEDIWEVVSNLKPIKKESFVYKKQIKMRKKKINK